MKINKDGKIEFDIEEIWESLATDQKKQFIKSCAISPDIIKWVMDWICGEDEDGWWTTEHPLRELLLARVEEKQLTNPVTKYNWTLIQKAVEQLKKVCSEKHLYWELFHHPAKREITIDKFLEGKDHLNEFYTTAADEKIEEVLEIVRNAVQPKIRG